MQIRKRGQRDNDTSGYNSDEEEKSVIRKTIKSFDIHDKVKPTSTPTKTKSHSGAFGWFLLDFCISFVFFIF